MHTHSQISSVGADLLHGGEFFATFADGYTLRGTFQPGIGIGVYRDAGDRCPDEGRNAGNPLAATVTCANKENLLALLIELAGMANDPVIYSELTCQTSAWPTLGAASSLPAPGQFRWQWDPNGGWADTTATKAAITVPAHTYTVDPADAADIPAPMPWFDETAASTTLRILELAHKAAPGMPNNVALWGESGTGKSTIVRYYAAITGVPFARTTMSQTVSARQLFGKEGLNSTGSVPVEGFLPRAISRPGVVLIDEITRSDPANWSNILQLLELGAGDEMWFETGAGRIRLARDKHCLIVFAFNEGHKHAGLFELGEAFNRRCMFAEVTHTRDTFALAAKASLTRFVDAHADGGGDTSLLAAAWTRHLDDFVGVALAIREDETLHEMQDVCPEDAAVAAFYAAFLDAPTAYRMKFRDRLRDPYAREQLDAVLREHAGDFGKIVGG